MTPTQARELLQSLHAHIDEISEKVESAESRTRRVQGHAALIARRRVASLRHELYEAHRLIDGLHRRFPDRATPASRRAAYRIFTLSAPSGFRTPDPLVFIRRGRSSTKASDQPKQNVASPRFSHGIVENRRALGETRAPLTPLPGAWATIRELGERDMATPTACQCHRRHGIASAQAICPSKPSDVAMSR